MRATIPVTVAVSALALLMGAAPATAAKKKPRSCAAKKSVTVALSTQGRVYRRGDRIYACSYRSKKHTRLGADSDCQGRIEVRDFRFGRGVLGFVASSCNLDTIDESIRVIRLRSGRTLWTVKAVDDDPARGEFSSEVTNWEMRFNGSLVWIGRVFNVTPEEFQVWKYEADVQNPLQKLAAGGDIDPDSLAIGRGSTFSSPAYWRQGGAIFTTALR